MNSIRIKIAKWLAPELFETLRDVKDILAGADISSLPRDMGIKSVAAKRMEDIGKLTWQVSDTCTRAERAEADLDPWKHSADYFGGKAMGYVIALRNIQAQRTPGANATVKRMADIAEAALHPQSPEGTGETRT